MGDFVRALKLVELGFEQWKDKPPNAKWFKRIDGTPIPNDLCVCIAETLATVNAIAEASTYSRGYQDAAIAERDAAIAESARLREALEKARNYIAEAAPGTGLVLAAIDAALSARKGEGE